MMRPARVELFNGVLEKSLDIELPDSYRPSEVEIEEYRKAAMAQRPKRVDSEYEPSFMEDFDNWFLWVHYGLGSSGSKKLRRDTQRMEYTMSIHKHSGISYEDI